MLVHRRCVATLLAVFFTIVAGVMFPFADLGIAHASSEILEESGNEFEEDREGEELGEETSE